jgi:putative DNA primase/helicase
MAANGLNPPASVVAATEEYFEAEDILGRWLDECCRLHVSGFQTTAELFASWRDGAEASGEYVGSLKRFSENLAARGLRKGRDRQGDRMGFFGLLFKEAPFNAHSFYENA